MAWKRAGNLWKRCANCKRRLKPFVESTTAVFCHRCFYVPDPEDFSEDDPLRVIAERRLLRARQGSRRHRPRR